MIEWFIAQLGNEHLDTLVANTDDGIEGGYPFAATRCAVQTEPSDELTVRLGYERALPMLAESEARERRPDGGTEDQFGF
jgi:hypothetical protein